MNTFTLNGNTIVAKKVDFNLLCDLDDLGVSIQDSGKKPLAFVRAYVAICMESDLETAGKAIQDHIAAGGNIEDLIAVLNKQMDDSDFFRNQQSEDNQAEASKTPTKTNKKGTKITEN